MTKKTPSEKQPEKPKGPVRKAFTVEKIDGAWSQITISYQDDAIISINRTVPDIRPIAIERFKIEAFNYWSKYDEAS